MSFPGCEDPRYLEEVARCRKRLRESHYERDGAAWRLDELEHFAIAWLTVGWLAREIGAPGAEVKT